MSRSQHGVALSIWLVSGSVVVVQVKRWTINKASRWDASVKATTELPASDKSGYLAVKHWRLKGAASILKRSFILGHSAAKQEAPKSSSSKFGQNIQKFPKTAGKCITFLEYSEKYRSGVEVQRLRCLAKLYLSSCLQIPFRSKRERSLNTVTYYMSNVFWPAWAIDLFAKKSGHQGARICGAVCPGMSYLPSNVKPTENGRKVSGHTPDYGNAINSL